MILYMILLGTMAWPASRCEPPVNSYLPPSGSSLPGADPSSEIRPPGRSDGLSQRQPQDSYSIGQIGPSIDTQYGPPSQRRNGQVSQGTTLSPGSFNNGKSSTPSSQYGVPGQNGGSSRGSNGSPNQGSGRGNGNGLAGSSNSGFDQGPQTSYGPPSTGFGNIAPTSQRLTSQGTPDSSSNSAPLGDFGGQSSGSPSSLYGAPGFGVDPDGPNASSQDGSFGVANDGHGGRGSSRSENYEEGESNEPAKYEFSYDVDDSQTGTKFGHSEQRDGDLATGEYNVVLPDGRKQIVEYEAGIQGYKPQIRYEGGVTGGSGSGFGTGAGGPGASQGYSQGGPNSNFASGSRNEQEPQSGRYQELGGIGDDSANKGYPRGVPQSGLDSGYPSGGRNGNGSGRNGNGEGYPGGAPQSGSDSGYPSSGKNGNGSKRNGNGEGYSRGGRQGGSTGGYPNGGNNGNGSGHNGNGEGYPRGGPGGGQANRGFSDYQNGNTDRLRSQNGNGEGYPSGRPSGPRGTGY